MNSFLLIGQSNMSGRGYISDVPAIDNTNMFVLRNGLWRELTEPINYDRPTAGISLAGGFATAYVNENPHSQIGFIPCADGGTIIEEWEKPNPLYINALNNARLAMRSSSLQGILWHQGESNCMQNKLEGYEKKLTQLINNFRADLQINNLPFIVGGLGPYLSKNTHIDYSLCVKLNEIVNKVATAQTNCNFVSADGLTSNDDLLHFDAKSLRELGGRYYQAFRELNYYNDTGNNISSEHAINPLTNL